MTGTSGSLHSPTLLEARYRRLLRILPAAYRLQWEEEMAATFMASMATDDPEEAEFLAHCGRPGWSERASVVGLSIRLRLGGVDAPPQALLWGQAVRRLALIVLLANAVGATAMVAQQAWIAGLVPWPHVPDHIATIADRGRPLPLDVAAAVAWVGAYGSLVMGRWRTAKALAALAFVPSIIGAVFSTFSLLVGAESSPWLSVISQWVVLGIMGVLLISLTAFHHGADTVRPRPWMLAFAIGLPVTAVAQIGLLTAPGFPGPVLVPSGVWSVALLVVAVWTLARRHHTDVVGWTLTLTMLVIGVLSMRVVSLVPQLVLAGGLEPAVRSLALVELLGLASVGVVLIGRARRELRRPPDRNQPVPLPS